ncbi:DHA2 family efflux MFS transporter permease subunit [Oleiagrimonas sp. C23AA]|uniref:DHA2 family efflux MFS transporter permease subunit n=1 Tax=Oleiagrimonas sp. C23AA TaxID=2719047 RepID=UPI00141F0E3F|nr:DHA2 family efflux MFS transporter permease subunit [Oleiagrimonas sp. C23AA]NII10916.1 DHA2 family efflux MFS transporter permease subunit [Oleiagrimonas sp. C23AA]
MTSRASPALTPTDDPDALAAHRGLLWLVSAALFMQTLDSTIVNAAVPTIADALAVTPLSLKSALTAYVLTIAVCVPASPWLVDRLGTRRLIGVAFAVFSLGSLACGLAQSLDQLVVSRVLQGMGGALMMPVGRYVLARTFSKRALVQAMSMVTLPAMLGPVLGPLLGGALAEYGDWRLIFLINLPVGALGLWLTQRFMPEIRGERRRFDLAGFTYFALASGLLMAGADRAADGRAKLAVLACLAAGALFAVLLVWHTRRTEHPVADLRLFASRSFSISVLGNICTRLAAAGMPFVLVLFLQLGCDWSPLAAGLILVPQAMGMMLMKLGITRILVQFGYRRALVANTLIIAVLLSAFGLLGADTPSWAVALLVFVYGLAMSLQYTAMNTLAFQDIGPDQAAHASSLTSSMQFLGISFGIALASLLMEALVGDLHTHAAAYVHAFHLTVWWLAGMAVLAAAVFTRLRRDRPGRETA